MARRRKMRISTGVNLINDRIKCFCTLHHSKEMIAFDQKNSVNTTRKNYG